MDALMFLLLIVSGLAGLGLAAGRFGADSRDGMTDDHRRHPTT
jgi:hypothetical protein